MWSIDCGSHHNHICLSLICYSNASISRITTVVQCTRQLNRHFAGPTAVKACALRTMSFQAPESLTERCGMWFFYRNLALKFEKCAKFEGQLMFSPVHWCTKINNVYDCIFCAIMMFWYFPLYKKSFKFSD